jgi:hypothetical protein
MVKLSSVLGARQIELEFDGSVLSRMMMDDEVIEQTELIDAMAFLLFMTRRAQTITRVLEIPDGEFDALQRGIVHLSQQARHAMCLLKRDAANHVIPHHSTRFIECDQRPRTGLKPVVLEAFYGVAKSFLQRGCSCLEIADALNLDLTWTRIALVHLRRSGFARELIPATR